MRSLQHDQVAFCGYLFDDILKQRSPFTRPIRHRGFPEFIRLERQHDPAPYMKFFGGIERQEIGPAGCRAYQDRYVTFREQIENALSDDVLHL